MIVILEGVDGSGKTTLWKQLQARGCKTVYVKPSVNEVYEWERHKIYFHKECAISDRSFISDLAYRLEDKLPRRGMDLRNMIITLSSDIKVIFLESGSEYNDSMRRGEDNITERKVSNRIKKNYKIIADMLDIFTNVPIMRYNWKKQSVDDVINFITGGKEGKYGIR